MLLIYADRSINLPIYLNIMQLAAGSTMFFYYYKDPLADNPHTLTFDLSWILMSIALVFPLSMTMTQTFKRREYALVQLQVLKSNMLSLFLSHFEWDWYTVPSSVQEPIISGRAESLEAKTLSKYHCIELKNILF